MIILFKIILLLSIWVVGIKIATSEGMLFEKIGEWGEKKVNDGYIIFDALIVCPWCLPSVHSIFGYGFAFALGVLPLEWNWKFLIMWPLVVMGCSFLCGNAWNIYETIVKVKQKAEEEIKVIRHKEQLLFFEIKDRKQSHNRKINS